jgi:hypothetical protein
VAAAERAPALDATDANHAATAPVLSPVAAASLPTATAVADRRKPTARPAAGSPSRTETARAVAAFGVANLGCQLSGPERRATDSCTGAQRLSGVSPALLDNVSGRSSSQGPAAAAPADTDPGGSSVGGRPPTSPGPGSAPGGAAGGSAAGGSGVAFAAFLSLAALLRLAPSRAMRRLRLSCEPWLTACFALIPERPG